MVLGPLGGCHCPGRGVQGSCSFCLSQEELTYPSQPSLDIDPGTFFTLLGPAFLSWLLGEAGGGAESHPRKDRSFCMVLPKEAKMVASETRRQLQANTRTRVHIPHAHMKSWAWSRISGSRTLRTPRSPQPPLPVTVQAFPVRHIFREGLIPHLLCPTSDREIWGSEQKNYL